MLHRFRHEWQQEYTKCFVPHISEGQYYLTVTVSHDSPSHLKQPKYTKHQLSDFEQLVAKDND